MSGRGDLKALSDCLCGGGGPGKTKKLPRRAVVRPDRTIGDRTEDPGLPEVPVLSRACALLGASLGHAVHSTDTADLLRACLEANQEGAWRALLDDVDTGDFDDAAAGGVFGPHAGGKSPGRLIECAADATSGVHVSLVVLAVRRLAPLLHQEWHRKRMAEAFAAGTTFPAIVDAVTRMYTDSAASPEVMATVASTLSSVVDWGSMQLQNVANMMEACLDNAPADAMRLFTKAPVARAVAMRPALAELLVAKAERGGAQSCYSACALLAVVDPALLDAHRVRVLALVHRALGDMCTQRRMVDAKLGVACGVLLEKRAGKGTLDRAVATTLTQLARHCIVNVTTGDS